MKNIELIRKATVDYQTALTNCIATQDAISRRYVDYVVSLGLTEEEAVEWHLEISAKVSREYFHSTDDDDETKDVLLRFLDLM